MTNVSVLKKISMAVLAVAVVFCVAGCGAQGDVNFARNVMNDLIDGRYWVRHHIAWGSLVVLENDLGQQYNALPNDKEKAEYERAFIENFKKGFQSQKATKQSFVNWRMFNAEDPKVTYVAADNANGSSTMIFYVLHIKHQRKLMGIRGIQVPDRQKYVEFEKEQQHVLQTEPKLAQ